MLELSIRKRYHLLLSRLVSKKRYISFGEWDGLLFESIVTKNVDGLNIILKQPFVEQNDYSSNCIWSAVKFGNTDIMRILLDDRRIDPSNYTNIAIMSAIFDGLLDIVKLLLDDCRVNPSVRDNWAMRSSIAHDQSDMISILSKHPKVMETFDMKQVEKYFATADNKHK